MRKKVFFLNLFFAINHNIMQVPAIFINQD